MIRRYSIIMILALISFTNCFSQPLSGSKTIGGISPDYNTLTDAINALNDNGVNGAVVFNVRSGTYTEQITLTEITGVSSSNTITFQSESGDSSDVTIDYAPSSAPSNYTVNMNGVDYVTFKNLTISSSGSTYAKVLSIYNSASNNQFLNCQFIGITTSSGTETFSLIHSYGHKDDNNSFESNYFKDGSYGIYYVGADPGDETGTIIRKNYFSNQYTSAIYIRHQDAPVIDSNYIETNTSKTDIQCIYVWECVNDLSIQKNTISLPSSSGGYGIYLYSSDGISSAKGLVANNFIQLNSSGNFSCGIYMRFCDYQQFYYNTINLTGGMASASCIFLGSGNAYTSITNNILYNKATGYALYVSETAAISGSDYNDLITTGTNLCYYNGNITDLSDWQSSTPHGDNSISIDPFFLSEQDLHANNTSLRSGIALTEVTTDIDGESRDGATPCMGADEFIYTALGGTYTIGSGGSDYTSITEAVQAIIDGGIRDAVYFNIENGIYNEQIVIPDISNTSPVNRITFQSASGDSSMVELNYSPVGSGANYTLQLNDAHYIDFKDMTLSSGGTDYSGVIEIKGGSSNLRFQNTQIIGGESAGMNNGILVKGDVEAVGENIEFIGNLMQHGTYGIKIGGDNTTKISVDGNHFLDQSYWSVNLITIKAPVVSGNYFNYSKSSVFYGVYFHACDSALKLSNNYFVAPNSSEGFGLWHKLCDGDATDYGLVSNNYMNINCSGTYAYGIYCDESTYQKFYHNSINVIGNLQSTRALTLATGCSDISIRNNIISNEANGYSCYSEVTSNITSNYNNLYSSGTNIGYCSGANRTDLSAWQTVSGQDANSVSLDPRFAALDEPHFPNPLLNDAGTPIAEVTDDIDEEMRDPTAPDIGADEFCLPPVADNKAGCTTRAIPDLTATGSNVQWYSDGALTTLIHSGNNFTTGHATAGIYTYFVTQTINESESQADTVILTINITPGLPSASDETICFGESTPDLTATGTDLKWYDDEALTNQVHAGSPFATGETDPGTYTWYITQTQDGCESDPDTSVLTIHSIPDPPENELFISCFGDTVPDMVATGENVKWYSDEELINLVHIGDIFSSGDTLPGYYVYHPTQTVNGCESGPGYDTLWIKPRPEEPLADSQAVCIGENVPDLTATGTDIKWYEDADRENLVHNGNTYSTGETGIGVYPYYVTQTVNGCESLNKLVALAINGLPDPSVLADKVICEVDTQEFQLGATALVTHSYSWTSSQGDLTSSEANPVVKPTAPGGYKYFLTETIDSTGCQASDIVTITIHPDPLATVLADQILCHSEIRAFQIGASAIAGNSYSWISNPVGFVNTEANPTITPTGSITYILTENIYLTGCSKTDSVAFTIHPNPVPVVLDDQVICEVDINEFQLSAASAVPGHSYSWTSSQGDLISADANPVVKPTAPGTYKYILTETIDSTGCQAIDSVTITIHPDPLATVLTDQVLCHSEIRAFQIGASAIAGNSYSWVSNPAGFVNEEANPTVTPDKSIIYILTETINLTGCNKTDSVTFTINPNPDATVLDDQTICHSEIQEFSLGAAAVPGNSYSWTSNPGTFTSTQSNPKVTPEATTEYTLTETIGATDCENTNSVTITINPNPVVSITAGQNPIDQGGSTNLNASGASTYQWSPATGLSSTTGGQVTADPDEITTYFVEGTNNFGCTGTDTITLYIYCPECSDTTYFKSTGSFNFGCTNNLYKNNMECSWTILPSGVDTIYLNFDLNSFDIKQDDNIRVYNGQDATKPLIGEYNNNNLPPANIKGKNALHIRFVTDGDTTGTGFQAKWSNTPFIVGEFYPQLQEQFRIYPNPADDKLFIESDAVTGKSIRVFVYNSLGQMVMNRQWENPGGQIREEVDISDFKAGMYLVRIVGSEDIYTQRVIKK